MPYHYNNVRMIIKSFHYIITIMSKSAAVHLLQHWNYLKLILQKEELLILVSLWTKKHAFVSGSTVLWYGQIFYQLVGQKQKPVQCTIDFQDGMAECFHIMQCNGFVPTTHVKVGQSFCPKWQDSQRKWNCWSCLKCSLVLWQLASFASASEDSAIWW